MCEGSFIMWSDEVLRSPILAWWIGEWVFLAAGSHRDAAMCEMNTRDICNKFTLFTFVTSIRASCWSAAGTRSTKSGRRSMSHCPTTAYCPITPVSMWVSVLTEHSEALRCRKRCWRLVVDGNGWCLALAGLHAECSRERDGPSASDGEGARKATTSRCAHLRPSSRAQRAGQRRAGTRGSQPRSKDKHVSVLLFYFNASKKYPKLNQFLYQNLWIGIEQYEKKYNLSSFLTIRGIIAILCDSEWAGMIKKKLLKRWSWGKSSRQNYSKCIVQWILRFCEEGSSLQKGNKMHGNAKSL